MTPTPEASRRLAVAERGLSGRQLLLVGLTSPVFLLLLVPSVVWALLAEFRWFPNLWMTTWGAIAVACIVAIGLVLPPQTFTPNRTLTAEVSKVGGVIRGGLGLFVAAVVGAMAAMTVERDLTVVNNGLRESMSLFGLVAEVIVIVVAMRILFGIAFQFQIASPHARTRASRLALGWVIVTLRRRQQLRTMITHPVFRHWFATFSDPRAYWVGAVLGSLATILGVISAVEWVVAITRA